MKNLYLLFSFMTTDTYIINMKHSLCVAIINITAVQTFGNKSENYQEQKFYI
jgi:hypothetical protein